MGNSSGVSRKYYCGSLILLRCLIPGGVVLLLIRCTTVGGDRLMMEKKAIK